MNCPSRTDDTDGRDGWNQNPNLLSGTTREDFNGMANTRILRRIASNDPVLLVSNDEVQDAQRPRKNSAATVRIARTLTNQSLPRDHVNGITSNRDDSHAGTSYSSGAANFFAKARRVLVKFSKFIGPGFMVSTTQIRHITLQNP